MKNRIMERILVIDDDVELCTLVGEYRLASKRFGFSEEELRGLADNSFRYAFRKAL